MAKNDIVITVNSEAMAHIGRNFDNVIHMIVTLAIESESSIITTCSEQQKAALVDKGMVLLDDDGKMIPNLAYQPFQAEGEDEDCPSA